MEVIGFLKKQPKWVMHKVDGKLHTGHDGCRRYGIVDGVSALLPIEETPVPIIRANLKLESYGRGRSSATFCFVDEDDGSAFHASMKCAFDILLHTDKGRISGLFTFTKQGNQISIMRHTVIGEQEIDD